MRAAVSWGIERGGWCEVVADHTVIYYHGRMRSSMIQFGMDFMQISLSQIITKNLTNRMIRH